MPVLFLVLIFLFYVAFFKNASMARFLIIRNKSKSKLNPAILASIFMSIAMLFEIARHGDYFFRIIGMLDDETISHSQIFTSGSAVFFIAASLCTVTLAWIDIAEDSKHLKKSSGKHADNPLFPLLDFRKSRIMLYSVLFVIFVMSLFLFWIKLVSLMTIVAMVVQAVLCILMIIGGRGLSAMLPSARPGQVDLGALINRTTKMFLIAFLFNLFGGGIIMTARDLILRNGMRDEYTFILTLGTVFCAVNSGSIGFIMHNFFWVSNEKARKDMMASRINRLAASSILKKPSSSKKIELGKSESVPSEFTDNPLTRGGGKHKERKSKLTRMSIRFVDRFAAFNSAGSDGLGGSQKIKRGLDIHSGGGLKNSEQGSESRTSGESEVNVRGGESESFCNQLSTGTLKTAQL